MILYYLAVIWSGPMKIGFRSGWSSGNYGYAYWDDIRYGSTPTTPERTIPVQIDSKSYLIMKKNEEDISNVQPPNRSLIIRASTLFTFLCKQKGNMSVKDVSLEIYSKTGLSVPIFF